MSTNTYGLLGVASDYVRLTIVVDVCACDEKGFYAASDLWRDGDYG